MWLWLDLREKVMLWKFRRKLEHTQTYIDAFMYSRQDSKTLEHQREFIEKAHNELLGDIDQYMVIRDSDNLITFRNEVRKQFRQWKSDNFQTLSKAYLRESHENLQKYVELCQQERDA